MQGQVAFEGKLLLDAAQGAVALGTRLAQPLQRRR
jgi:hypothetical protein